MVRRVESEIYLIESSSEILGLLVANVVGSERERVVRVFCFDEKVTGC